jgi:hypothetical protein
MGENMTTTTQAQTDTTPQISVREAGINCLYSGKIRGCQVRFLSAGTLFESAVRIANVIEKSRH